MFNPLKYEQNKTMKITKETIGSEGVELTVFIPSGMKKRYNEIVDASNDEGTIQAWDARELFSRPEYHTTMSIGRALSLAGFDFQP